MSQVLGVVLLIGAVLLIASRKFLISPLVRQMPPIPFWTFVALIFLLIALNLSDAGVSSLSGIISLLDLAIFLAGIGWMLWPRNSE